MFLFVRIQIRPPVVNTLGFAVLYMMCPGWLIKQFFSWVMWSEPGQAAGIILKQQEQAGM